jgi:hypothetical protein
MLKRAITSEGQNALVEGEDFYREGGFVVFTARYHLRRGYCCGSGCRHCPFEGGAARAESDEEGAVESESDV